MSSPSSTRFWCLAAVLCLLLAGVSGCQGNLSKQDADAELAAMKSGPNVLAPDWFRARYFAGGWFPAVSNGLLRNVAILSLIVLFVVTCFGYLWVTRDALPFQWDDPEEYGGFLAWMGIAFGSLIAIAAVLCVVGHVIFNVVAGLVRPDGEVPFAFSAFCVLVFLDLAGVFVGLSLVARKLRGQLPEAGAKENVQVADSQPKKKWTRNALLMAGAKSLAVSILSGIASHFGDWAGGLIVMGILAILAALFNPLAES